MSADNYIYVRKRPDGKYGVSDRSASTYYADEGWTVESLQASEPEFRVDESWIVRPERDHYGVFDTADEAVKAAFEAYRKEAIVEYGVQLAPDVEADWNG